MMTTCNDPGKKTEKDTAENELCFENIYKSYGKTKALQGFTATLKTGSTPCSVPTARANPR